MQCLSNNTVSWNATQAKIHSYKQQAYALHFCYKGTLGAALLLPWLLLRASCCKVSGTVKSPPAVTEPFELCTPRPLDLKPFWKL